MFELDWNTNLPQKILIKGQPVEKQVNDDDARHIFKYTHRVIICQQCRTL